MNTINDLNIENKKVIIRCDFNVPIKDGKIVDDTRIKESLETIKYCLKKNCKVILLSHLGRIKEEKDLEKNNLSPVAKDLSKLLNKKIIFSEKTKGKELEEKIENMNYGDVLLIQNTRYEDLEGQKESKNNSELGKYWASLGDIFINDAFGTAHRAHASNVGIASHLPSALGFLIEKELKALSTLEKPAHPFIVILGGAKVVDKIGVIKRLVTKADKILIGGGMAFTFLKAKGYEIGKSILDEGSIAFCKEVLKDYSEKIILPVDFAISTEYSNSGIYQEKDIENFAKNEIGLDIGSKTRKLFEKHIEKAAIVMWNGPLGVYEFDKYRKNTDEI